MHRVILVVIIAAFAASVALLAGCGGHSAQAPGAPGVVPDGGFVGAQVCETCHRSAFAAWTSTGHSDALAILERIGQGANAGCLGCHTVGFGTLTGYVSEDDTPQLGNVQCENCHGEGGNHVLNPQQNNMAVPLASDVCGSCHTGFHHPTYDQWETSAHGHALETLQTNSHASSSCLGCHSAEAILSQGEDVVLATTVTVKAENSITCVVCHSPHGSPHEAQLREPVTQICITCHTSGGALPGASPHHPQRELLLGLGGFEANGAEAQGPNSAHTNGVNARCVRCHVYQEHPADVTRDNPVNTGHTFLPKVPEACQECHPGDEGTQYLVAAEKEVHDLFAEIDALLAGIDPNTLSSDDKAKYDIAVFNRKLVEADASNGAHNTDYAVHLLEVAKGILQAL